MKNTFKSTGSQTIHGILLYMSQDRINNHNCPHTINNPNPLDLDTIKYPNPLNFSTRQHLMDPINKPNPIVMSTSTSQHPLDPINSPNHLYMSTSWNPPDVQHSTILRTSRPHTGPKVGL